MQDERLSLTLPLRPDVLRQAAHMLLGLASGIDGALSVLTTLEETTDPPLAADPPPVVDLPPPVPDGVELDEAKLPHDSRINPDSKTKIKTGTRAGCWKYKKQLDAVFITQVEDELRATMALAVPAPPVDPPLATDPPPPPAIDQVAPAAAAGLDFPGIIQKVTALQNANRISPEQVQGVATAVGLASFTLLGTRPDLIPAVNLEIDKLCPPIQS